MKTNLEKLTNLLCKDEEVKKDIIWNDIQDHHLRIYCFNKNIKIEYSKQNILFIKNDYWVYINYNYTKPLHQQNEETFWQIYNFLIKEKG